MLEMKKVVFKDGNVNKTARGNIEYENGFIKVTDRKGDSILINKEYIVFIRDD